MSDFDEIIATARTIVDPLAATKRIARLVELVKKADEILNAGHECPGCDTYHRDGHQDHCACLACVLIAAYDELRKGVEL